MNPSFQLLTSGTALAMAGLLLASCAAAPERPPRHRVVRQAAPPPAPPPPTQVYFYPTRGQSAERQSRDRYDCHLWAVKESRFDPSLPQYARRHRVEYVAAPAPGHDTVAGAMTGAVIGAVVGGNPGKGAVVGAIAGGALGAASDSARAAEADRINNRLSQREAASEARLQEKADGYRRAMGACLQGRGYSVQ